MFHRLAGICDAPGRAGQLAAEDAILRGELSRLELCILLLFDHLPFLHLEPQQLRSQVDGAALVDKGGVHDGHEALDGAGEAEEIARQHQDLAQCLSELEGQLTQSEVERHRSHPDLLGDVRDDRERGRQALAREVGDLADELGRVGADVVKVLGDVPKDAHEVVLGGLVEEELVQPLEVRRQRGHVHLELSGLLAYHLHGFLFGHLLRHLSHLIRLLARRLRQAALGELVHVRCPCRCQRRRPLADEGFRIGRGLLHLLD
mmetsp:Transcript_48051/g.118954  ORF Transcript_48051/g.118954 Transcript_48051/m.118954 type:complete len:261 (-) Transcript_48051:178-960(-)